jgi:extracellular matrix regulatory protein A
MARWVMMGMGGAVDAEKVVAVVSAQSTPVKRLLKTTPKERVFNMTYGYPRRSVMLFDNGYLAVVSMPVDELAEHLNQAVTNDG